MYLNGAIRNLELAPKIYPGWKCVFWIGQNVPKEVVAVLRDGNAETLDCPVANPMLSRFLVHDDPGVERYLIRDCDSRLNAREARAVTEWIKDDRKFHVIRDHPGHQVAMPGGLWGGVPGRFSMRQLIDAWKGAKNAGPRNSIYNNDQVFLRESVWPIIKDDCLQHDFCCRDIFRTAAPFPARFGDWRFCGEIFDHQDNPERYGWQKRMNWMAP